MSNIGQSADAGFNILSLMGTEPSTLTEVACHLKQLDKDVLPCFNGRALVTKRAPEEFRYNIHHTRCH